MLKYSSLALVIIPISVCCWSSPVILLEQEAFGPLITFVVMRYTYIAAIAVVIDKQVAWTGESTVAMLRQLSCHVVVTIGIAIEEVGP